jgi:hypothetical protein
MERPRKLSIKQEAGLKHVILFVLMTMMMMMNEQGLLNTGFWKEGFVTRDIRSLLNPFRFPEKKKKILCSSLISRMQNTWAPRSDIRIQKQILS